MEEDIKILELTLEDSKDYGQYCLTRTELDAIETLLTRYKELEEENKRLNANLVYRKLQLTECIPISVIRDKIDKLEKEEKEIKEPFGIFKSMLLTASATTLKELLEERK